MTSGITASPWLLQSASNGATPPTSCRDANAAIGCAQQESAAELIDAKNDRAARWYQSYGALGLDDEPLSLVLPLAVAADAIKRGINTT